MQLGVRKRHSRKCTVRARTYKGGGGAEGPLSHSHQPKPSGLEQAV